MRHQRPHIVLKRHVWFVYRDISQRDNLWAVPLYIGDRETAIRRAEQFWKTSPAWVKLVLVA